MPPFALREHVQKLVCALLTCLGFFRSIHDSSSAPNCMVDLTNWKFSLFDVIFYTCITDEQNWKWNLCLVPASSGLMHQVSIN